MSYGLNLGWGGPIGDYIGLLGGTYQGIYYKFSPGPINLGNSGCQTPVIGQLMQIQPSSVAANRLVQAAWFRIWGFPELGVPS